MHLAHLTLKIFATACDVAMTGRLCLADLPGESGFGSYGRLFAWLVCGVFVAWAIWA